MNHDMHRLHVVVEEMLSSMGGLKEPINMSNFGSRFAAQYGTPVWRKLKALGFGPNIIAENDSLKLKKDPCRSSFDLNDEEPHEIQREEGHVFSIDGTPVFIVDTLDRVVDMSRQMKSANLHLLALDTEGDLVKHGHVSLMQLYAPSLGVFLVDVFSLWKHPDPELGSIRQALQRVLEDHTVQKVIHDCRRDVATIAEHMKIKVSPFIDTQLMYSVYESMQAGGASHPDLRISLNKLLDEMGASQNTLKDGFHQLFSDADALDVNIWERRPMTREMALYAAKDVISLVHARNVLLSRICERTGSLMERVLERGSALCASDFLFQNTVCDRVSAGLTMVVDYDEKSELPTFLSPIQVTPSMKTRIQASIDPSWADQQNRASWELLLHKLPSAVVSKITESAEDYRDLSALSLNLQSSPPFLRLHLRNGTVRALQLEESLALVESCQVLQQACMIPGTLHTIVHTASPEQVLIHIHHPYPEDFLPLYTLVRDVFLSTLHPRHSARNWSNVLVVGPNRAEILFLLRHLCVVLSNPHGRSCDVRLVDCTGKFSAFAGDMVNFSTVEEAVDDEESFRGTLVVPNCWDDASAWKSLSAVARNGKIIASCSAYRSLSEVLPDAEFIRENIFDIVVEVLSPNKVKVFRDVEAAVKGMHAKCHYTLEERWFDESSHLPLVHRKECHRSALQGTHEPCTPLESWYDEVILRVLAEQRFAADAPSSTVEEKQ